MTLAIAFYVLMLLWLVFWWWTPHPYAPNIVLFLLLLCLGWKAFGPPIHG